MAAKREPYTLEQQASELRLLIKERKDFLETKSNARRDPMPKEAAGLMAIRIEILEDACATVEKAAAARAKFAKARP